MQAAPEVVFPLASRIGLIPPTGLKISTSFTGFADQQNQVFVRVIARPGAAFAEIEKTMTNDALKKQGMAIEKRETVALPSGNAILVVARQETGAARIRKWLLIAPIDGITALVSFELPVEAPAGYSDKVIRTALTSLAARKTVPVDEQL